MADLPGAGIPASSHFGCMASVPWLFSLKKYQLRPETPLSLNHVSPRIGVGIKCQRTTPWPVHNSSRSLFPNETTMTVNPVIITQNDATAVTRVNSESFKIFQRSPEFLDFIRVSCCPRLDCRIEFEWLPAAGVQRRELKFVKTADPATLPDGWALGAVGRVCASQAELNSHSGFCAIAGLPSRCGLN